MTILLLLVLILFTTSTNGLSIKLLHRFSLPAYQNEDFQSFFRNNILEYEFTPKVPIVQPIINSIYFVNISIGEPPQPQFLVMDTGSSVVWVRGFPTLYQKSYYNRHASSTLKYVKCNNPECSLNSRFFCGGTKNLCYFAIFYGDSVHRTNGYMGLERFGFESESPATLNNVLFGVSTYTDGKFYKESKFNGVLGLGPLASSLISRNFPKKFSYCFGNIRDSDSPSYLNLGQVDLDAFTTYLYKDDTPFYRADVECIYIQQTCLPISADVLRVQENDPYSGVTFDTGTVFSYLADEAYDAVVIKVVQLMSLRGFHESFSSDTQLCYDGRMEDLSEFPPLFFGFDEHLDLNIRLNKESLFYTRQPDTFCITIIKSSSKHANFKRFTIIGLMAQQHHVMGFDLENSLLAIDYADSSCGPL